MDRRSSRVTVIHKTRQRDDFVQCRDKTTALNLRLEKGYQKAQDPLSPAAKY
jgi:hypothetical protein